MATDGSLKTTGTWALPLSPWGTYQLAVWPFSARRPGRVLNTTPAELTAIALALEECPSVESKPTCWSLWHFALVYNELAPRSHFIKMQSAHLSLITYVVKLLNQR